MVNLIEELGQHAAHALQTAYGPLFQGPSPLPVQTASRVEFGDLQLSSCLSLAKPMGRPPRELAIHVQNALQTHPAVERIEIAGPGYVNVFLQDKWLLERMQQLSQDTQCGVLSKYQHQTVIVDFSSPNIAKPMHIGHIRSTILGDGLQRVFRAVGYRVLSDNHLGDWGTQFGKLIVAYRLWLDKTAYAQHPVEELVRLYQLFVAEEKRQADASGTTRRPQTEEEEQEDTRTTTPLLAAAKTELRKLQQGDENNLALWKEFVRVSMESFSKSYAQLQVVFDMQLGESFYHPYLAPLVQRLLEQGLAVRSQGAVVCPVEAEPAPLIIQKQDGAFLYGTTDLATVQYRKETWNPSRILYVVGVPQQLHFRQVFAVARKMGISCSLEHIAFGSIQFRDKDTGKWTAGSTRKGNVPLLDELLTEAIERAKQILAEKNPSLSQEEQQRIATMVGLGAVKYNNLNRDRLADIHFDWDQALSFEGNTAPYIQYAYARLRSIGRKAQEENISLEDTVFSISHPLERGLICRLLAYGGVVEQATQTAKLHGLTEYLYQLSTQANHYYHEIPVLKAIDPADRAPRLCLLHQVARILRHGLELLGIGAPERM